MKWKLKRMRNKRFFGPYCYESNIGHALREMFTQKLKELTGAENKEKSLNNPTQT